MPGAVFQHRTIAGATEDHATPILAAPDESDLLVLAVGFYISTFATADVYLNMVLIPPNQPPGGNTEVALGEGALNQGLYCVAAGQASAGAAGVDGGNTLYPATKWYGTWVPLIIPAGWSLAIWFTNANPDGNTYEIYSCGIPHAP